MERSYWPRLVDGLLARDLGTFGAVLIEGPRSCGKTVTASESAASMVRLDTDDNARQLAEVQPELLLRGDQPRLIDEWQVFPRLWDHVRRAVDDSGGLPGQFILTGSATPADKARVHSGTGRIARLRHRGDLARFSPRNRDWSWKTHAPRHCARPEPGWHSPTS